jgi:hypothetical protein
VKSKQVGTVFSGYEREHRASNVEAASAKTPDGRERSAAGEKMELSVVDFLPFLVGFE